MKTTYDAQKNCWIIDIAMDMDLYNVPKLKEIMLECLEEKQASFVLDCHEMSYMDSTGLGVLASMMNRVHPFGGTITIRGLRPHIKRIFSITGLDTKFVIEE